jgi:hypothetical protein
VKRRPTEEEINRAYVDQAGSSSVFGDRRITSAYGIHCIDGEYCRRIRNILDPVQKLIKVTRAHHNEIISVGGHVSHWDYWDDYEELPLDRDYYSYDKCAFIHGAPKAPPKFTMSCKTWFSTGPEMRWT